jgi:hypothetical protein
MEISGVSPQWTLKKGVHRRTDLEKRHYFSRGVLLSPDKKSALVNASVTAGHILELGKNFLGPAS